MALAPDRPGVRTNLARALIQAKRLAEAAAVVGEALAAAPKDPISLCQAGHLRRVIRMWPCRMRRGVEHHADQVTILAFDQLRPATFRQLSKHPLRTIFVGFAVEIEAREAVALDFLDELDRR